MKRELVKTSDGSHTLFLPEANEHYHSHHGAITESQHVFIKNGLLHYVELHAENPIRILEVGMGTGLNVFLSFLFSLEKQRPINFIALEPFPLEQELVQELNYTILLNATPYADCFNFIHTCACNSSVNLSENFILTKKKETLQETNLKEEINIVFFDAFAPRVQPELWTKEVFDQIYAILKPNGILVTYCAKGEVKRNLKAAGFKVESLQGPPGKREMVRAQKLV